MWPVLTFSLAALVATAPTKLPLTTEVGMAFRLIAKVTDPTKDLTPSVNDWVFTTAHTGAALNAAVLSASPPSNPAGRIFYENGTREEVEASQTTIITDGATPPTPFGVTVQGPTQFDPTYPKQHAIFVNAGAGSRGLYLPNRYPVLRNMQGSGWGTFLACNNTVPYYNMKFITLQYLYDGESYPEECVPIALVAQCATLNDLPDNAYASHEWVVPVRCYERDVITGVAISDLVGDDQQGQ